MKVPNVLCIGFAKCGTTTLYDIFKQHKDIYLSNIKEPLFWGNSLLESKGFDWYLDRYYHFANKDIIMEVNPVIGKCKKAEEIKSNYGPDTKIIIMIRNPVHRLYSNFKMNLIDGSSFKNIKDNLIPNASEAFEKWLFEEYVISSNEFGISFADRPRMSRSGNYYSVIKDYISTFKPENVSIIFFEDFINNTKETCKYLMDFIGVKKDDSINYDIHSNCGNRMPINQISIDILRFLIKNIIFNLEINPLVKSETYDKLINTLSWSLFDIFSKKTNNDKVTQLSYDVLSLYYNEMITLLSREMQINLYDKWNINVDKQHVLKK